MPRFSSPKKESSSEECLGYTCNYYNGDQRKRTHPWARGMVFMHLTNNPDKGGGLSKRPHNPRII